MKNNRKLGFIAWFVVLLASNILMFCLASGFTATFWCSLVFVWIATITSIVFQVKSWEPENKPKESILHLPLITIAISYMIIQIIVSIILSLGAAIIPFRLSVIINCIITALAWLLGIGGLVKNDHIDKVNQRQYKNNK